MADRSRSGESVLIVYFDGVCNLCNGFVDILIKIDRRRRLRYAPVQGATAKAGGVYADGSTPSSIIVAEGLIVLTESDAVLRIFSFLGGIWNLLAFGRLIPKPFRDGMYRVIAQNRYGLFGRRDSCRAPTSAERGLFLP